LPATEVRELFRVGFDSMRWYSRSTTTQGRDRQMDTMDTMEIGDGRRMLGAGDLSPLLGVSRPQVKELATQAWFPAPAVQLSQGDVWKMGDIQQMASQTGRTLDYPAYAAHVAAMRERQRANPEFRRCV